MRLSFLSGFVVAACAAALWVRGAGSQTPAPEAVDNPARRKIEYRPGGFFPPGFPLHGTVRLLSPPKVEMGQRTRVEVEYTIGDLEVEPGMAIEIWKHFTSDVEEFQTRSRDEPAWFGATFTAPGAQAAPKLYTNWIAQGSRGTDVFPYRRCAGVTLTQGRLKQGDKVLFDLGGPKGVRMQHYEENLFNFRVAVTRDEKVVGYGGDAAMSVGGGPLARLRVQAPSVVRADEPFPIEVLPVDEWGSLAKDHRGLALRAASAGTAGGRFRYDEELLHYVGEGFRAAGEGTLRITVETADGRFRATSNPVWVEKEPLHGVYFGELHQHTYLHDGRGVFDELYLYGRRVGLLDFGAVSPHHMPMSVTGPSLHLGTKRWPSENWPDLEKSTKLVNGWKEFVSVLGYEYSVPTKSGGHHNIYYNADRAQTVMQLDPADPMAPVAKMLQTVKLARVPALVIPHIGGGPPDWSHPTDPRIERLFEIASVHGVFEESWQKHLEAGQRLGAIAAGDTHTTSMGTAYPGLVYVMTNGLAGVYAQSRQRQSIWDGLYQKRTFAATGNQRMLVDFRVNGEQMGGEISSKMVRAARIEARVSGTAPLLRVELVKNGKVIYSVSPSAGQPRMVRVVWGDNLYQRRASTGLREGSLRPAGGAVQLRQVLHRDQAFEEVRQAGPAVAWKTAAVSNDRDGFLADLSGVEGPHLEFRLDDADTLGVMEARVPLEILRREGRFVWRAKAPATVEHPYMTAMGVPIEFTLECEMVNPDGPMDWQGSFEDREPPRPGDYYYLRVEQLDTNKAWSSPVWVN